MVRRLRIAGGTWRRAMLAPIDSNQRRRGLGKARRQVEAVFRQALEQGMTRDRFRALAAQHFGDKSP